MNCNAPRRFAPRFSLLLVLLTAPLLLSSAAFAQTTVATGSIAGTVNDATGAVVAGAKVTIVGSTGQTIKLTANGQGNYSTGSLIPGPYTVRIEAKGFKTAQLSLDVKVDNTASGSVKLEIGQESTVIDVQASDIQVNTEQATVQGVLTARQIETLPVNGRNFLDLAQLEAGRPDSGRCEFRSHQGRLLLHLVRWTVSAARPASSVDGVDISDETVGTTTEDIPASCIQEFALAQSTSIFPTT